MKGVIIANGVYHLYRCTHWRHCFMFDVCTYVYEKSEKHKKICDMNKNNKLILIYTFYTHLRTWYTYTKRGTLSRFFPILNKNHDSTHKMCVCAYILKREEKSSAVVLKHIGRKRGKYECVVYTFFLLIWCIYAHM